MRATLTRLTGTDTAALDIDGTPSGLIDPEFAGDDIDTAESGRMIGSCFYDLDALLLERGVARMPDGDYIENWREIETGLWTVELADAR